VHLTLSNRWLSLSEIYIKESTAGLRGTGTLKHQPLVKNFIMKTVAIISLLLPLLLSSGLTVACTTNADCSQPCSGRVCEGPWCFKGPGQATGQCHFICVPKGALCPVRCCHYRNAKKSHKGSSESIMAPSPAEQQMPQSDLSS
jgi:hypothetical protein